MKNETFTKDEIKAIEKFLDVAKEYYNEDAERYCGVKEKLFKTAISNMVHIEMMQIAVKVCKEKPEENGNVKINVL